MSKPWQDEETLRRLYHEEGLSRAKIAEEFDGVTRSGIQYWMNKYEIEARDKSEAAKERWLQNPDIYYLTNNLGYEACAVNTDGKDDYVLIHRLVAVAEYGFDAVKDKDVHHKNCIRWDNRPENLEPLTRKEHTHKHRGITDESQQSLGELEQA